MQPYEKILTTLKLAYKFSIEGDFRRSTIICDNSSDKETIFYATTGHTAIKITLDMDLFGAEFLKPYLTRESVERALKCKDLTLLAQDKTPVSDDFHKVVPGLINSTLNKQREPSPSVINTKYLAVVRDIGATTGSHAVKIETQGRKDATILTSKSSTVLVQAIIMPMAVDICLKNID